MRLSFDLPKMVLGFCVVKGRLLYLFGSCFPARWLCILTDSILECLWQVV